MGGRSDYEERRNSRIERYKMLSEKAKEKSLDSNSNAQRLLNITNGQPILVGHHSEKKHRRLLKRADNNMARAIEEEKKSDYYNYKAQSVQNSRTIYNDDPKAIEKLKDKLARLEHERDSIKAREHCTWELTNIGATIRETKKRIERLEKQENLEFNDIKFYGGKAIHNKEINRIQLIFDDIPDVEVRNTLKHNGFHWSRREGAWQREFNERTIQVVNSLIKDILIKQNENKEEEEELE